MDKRTCPQCGNDVVQKPRGTRRIYCTDECRALAQTIKRGGTPIPRTVRTCPVDGTQFSAAGTKKYCTPRCRKRAMNHAQRLREGGTTIPLDAPLQPPFDCAQCGKPCVPGENVAPQASRFCCDEHKKRWHKDRELGNSRSERRRASAQAKLARAAEGRPSTVTKWIAGPCAECGKPFVSRQRDAVACCAEHARRLQRRRSRRNRREKYGSETHRKRARRLGAKYEPVNVREVFERDDYRCGICGERTDPTAPACSPRYPTLDHVLPMARGGSHTLDNAQCACFECNWRKGADLPSDRRSALA